ncbi:Acyltransferase-like protein, chloroplastic [Capsicum baccatum]|uniref:Acyltransferase-like protein, chloroplastic n=1 Tax=Capsicum baccatum TaxID=33114 RepID=A0A2G2XI51_CAPBA|nr:Acyltransferase-like protein, chloroplastic [Capsicum baccatum]
MRMAAISTGVSPCLQYRHFSSTRLVRAASSTASIPHQPPKTPLLSNHRIALEDKTSLIMKGYLEWSKDMMIADGGPPRWFSPLDCAPPTTIDNFSPLLLYLPGIDGLGIGLIKHHTRLASGKYFQLTAPSDLVHLVETTVRSEHHRSPRRPIYLLGESFGGCLALAVAARNPHIDLALILANPATRLHESLLQNLIMLLEVLPEQLHPSMVKMLSVTTGVPARVAVTIPGSGHPLQQAVAELFRGDVAFSSYLSVRSKSLNL